MNLADIWPIFFALLLLAIVVFVLRFVSIFRPGLALAQAPQWRGIINGEAYNVGVFSTDAWTVALDYPKDYKSRFVASMRLTQPSPPNNQVAKHLNALAACGVDLVDFGVHSDWIAAETPFLRAAMSNENALKVAKQLVLLRKAVKPKDAATKSHKVDSPSTSAPTNAVAQAPSDLSRVLALFHRVFRRHLNRE